MISRSELVGHRLRQILSSFVESDDVSRFYTLQSVGVRSNDELQILMTVLHAELSLEDHKIALDWSGGDFVLHKLSDNHTTLSEFVIDGAADELDNPTIARHSYVEQLDLENHKVRFVAGKQPEC